MLAAIVGIEVRITKLVGKWKTSQNQPAVNREGVIKGLSEIANTDAASMANFVKQSISS